MDKLNEILEVYSLEEILEYNDEEVVDILAFLIREYGLKLPEVKPI
jgi:hypothetical protein